MKLIKNCFLCLWLIIAAGINAKCSARRSIGEIEYLGFSDHSTLENFRTQDRNKLIQQLNEKGTNVREQCLGSLEQMKIFIESVEYPEGAYSYVALYAGLPLTTPFWGLNDFCFAIISREDIDEP